jgi:hypothetical protein
LQGLTAWSLGGSNWQFHFLKESVVAQIFFDVAQQQIPFDTSESAVAVFVGTFDSFKRFVGITAVSVKLSNLKGGFILSILDVLRQRCICFFFLPFSIIGKIQCLTAPNWFGLVA